MPEEKVISNWEEIDDNTTPVVSSWDETESTTVKKKEVTKPLNNGSAKSDVSQLNSNSQSSTSNSNSVSPLINNGVVPDFRNQEIKGVTNTPKSNAFKKGEVFNPLTNSFISQDERKENIKQAKENPRQDKKTEQNSTPYAVDVTDKSKDNTKTQTDKNAQIQNDVDTGKLEENDITSYKGASNLYNKKAKEITGKDGAQALVDYGKVIGVDDDLFTRLDDGDKGIYQNQEQLKNLYEQRDILSNSDEQTQKSHLAEVNKAISEIEKTIAQSYLKRNSEIDSQILGLQKQLNNGTKVITVSTGSGTNVGQDGLEYGATKQEVVNLSDDEKSTIKSQIQSLQKRKEAFLKDASNPQEVYQDLLPKVKMYEDKNIIPKDASVIDKLKIYYGIKLTQLNELKKKEESDGNSFLFQANPILKAAGIDTRRIGKELIKSISQRIPGIDDRNIKAINDIELELDSIAPIIAINADPNAKRNGVVKTFVNKVADDLSQTTGFSQTSQQKASSIGNAMQGAGVELSDYRKQLLETQMQNKDIGQREEKNATSLGSTTAFMVDFGGTSVLAGGILNGVSKGLKLAKLALSPKAVALLGMAETAINETRIGRLAVNVVDEGLKYEITGDINKVLKENSNFSQGASGAIGSKLGEKTIEKLASILGKNAGGFLTLVFDTLGRTGVELFEETAQNTDQLMTEITGKNNFISGAIDLFKDSEKGKAFTDGLKQQYGNIDDDVDFVLQIAAMSTAFNIGKFGKYFKDLALKKRNELSPTDREKYDVIVHGMQDEVKDVEDKAVDEVAKLDGKKKEEVVAIINNKIGTAETQNSSTVTQVKTDIANKISKGDKLTNEEQDYYDVAKEDIDKLVAGSVSSSKTNDEKIVELEKELADIEDNNNPRIAEIDKEIEAAETKVIVSKAVIEIGGKMYEGNNHAEAILKAKADGQDISQVNRQAEGKFKLSDGTIIDRAESKSRFGQDRSELMIPQDENAKEANKEYAKITRKPLSKIAEKIKLDENQVTPIKPINTGQEQNNIGGVQQTPENNQGFQQGSGIGQVSGQEVSTEKVEEGVNAIQESSKKESAFDIVAKEEEIARKKQQADKDKALLDIELIKSGDTETIDKYFKKSGYKEITGNETDTRLKGKKGVYKNTGASIVIKKSKTDAALDSAINISNKKIQGLSNSRIEEIVKEFQSKQPTISKTETTENPALKDVEATAKALEGVDVVQHLRDKTNALRDEQGNIPKDKMEKFKALRKASGAVNDGLVQIPESNYENTGRSKKFTPKQISEAYHKAKADGSNPELVKAVEDLIGKPTAQTPENNQGFQQGDGQNVSNENEVAKVEEKQEVGSGVVGEVEVPKTLSELKLSDETTQTLENKLKELELERTNKLIENKGRGRFDDRLKDEIDEVKRKIYQRENELASRRNSDLESKIKDGSLLKLIAKNKITAEDARGLIIESGMEVPSEIQSIVDKNKQDKKENKQSIIERDTDFLGNEKEAYMVNNDKANGIRTQEDIEYFKSNVKRAIDNGKYQKAIADGKMTANDAKIIIESYGLKVPKDILEQSLKETTKAEPPKVEAGSGGVGGDGKKITITGYRNKGSKDVGENGTFYTQSEQDRPTNKKEISFDNALVLTDEQVEQFEGLPNEYLAYEWFPDVDFTKEAKRQGISESGHLMDKMVTEEAIKRGYDGIVYGTNEIVDLRTHPKAVEQPLKETTKAETQEVLSAKNEEITPKSSIEVDRNVDRIDNSQENIEISSSKKLKTNGSVEEGHSGVFGEDIVDNKGNIVGSKISDTRPNGGKYYQTLVDDTPENRKGFGWQEHQDIDGKIFKKFETLDDLEKFIDSKKEQLKETPISKTETTEKVSADEISVIAEKEVEREINHLVKTTSEKRAGLVEKNKLLKKQKETLLADLRKASEILLEQAGNNNDNVRGFIKDKTTTSESFLPETLTDETIAQLKELGIVVSTEKAKYNSELDKLKIDIIEDGSIKIPQRGIFDVIEMIEKEFPTEIKDIQYKQSTTPPKVSKSRYYTIAQDYSSVDIPKKKFEDAKDNLETAKKSGNKKLIEVMQENLNEAKAIYDIAKDLDYPELNIQKEVQKSKPLQEFSDATDITNSGINKREIYDAYKVFNKAIPKDVNKSTIEDVIVTVFANNLRKQEKSITDKQNELAKKKSDVQVILDKYKLKNGLGYKKVTTNSAVFELNRALRDLAQIEYETDFLKDNSKEINILLSGDANLQSTDKNFTPISKSKFNELLDKLKKAFPNVKVELFGKNDFENARKELEKWGTKIEAQSKSRQDRSGNEIGDGSYNVDYDVVDFSKYPQITTNVSLSESTETSYVTYTNRDNGKSITVRFSNHENNATKFGDQLNGNLATNDEILFKLGLKEREFIPATYLSISTRQVAQKKLQDFEEADKTIQEIYSLGKGADLSKYKGKLAKGSNLLIQSDKIEQVEKTRRNYFGDIVRLGDYVYKDVQFLKIKDGTIYGFKTPDGKVFLNSDNLNANTPIHEYGHIWQSVFPQGFARGIELLKLSPQGQALIREIQKNPAYKGKSLAEIHAEALVTAIGNKGEQTFKGNPSALKRFQEWLTDFFKTIGDKLGIKDLSADDKLDMFTKKVVGELLGGKVLSKEVGNGNLDFQVKDGLKEFVEDAKKEGYTKQETIDYVKDNNPEINEQDVIDTWDAVNEKAVDEKKEKAGKEKRLQNRAFDGTTDEELKSIIEDYGLTYETESQIIAEKEANDIIEEIGLERAFQAVQNGYIKGAQAAVVYAKMVDELDTKLADDKITDEERTRLKELQAYSIDIFDTEARDAGRFLSMLNRMYQKSLFTYDTMVKSATKAKGAPLTAEEKLQLKEQSEKIAEFDKKIKELEAKLDEERAQNAVKNIKALNNKPKTASFKAKAKALADKFRQLKSKPLVLKDADGNPIELTQNSIVSYNDIIEIAAKAIEKTGELLDGINTALQEIKKQKWYQNLSQRDKDAVDRQVKEELLNLDIDVSDDKFKIPNSLLREIVRNGTEDIDGIVEKVLEVYQDIYPDLDARKVRDIITKYGETIESKEDLIGDKLALAKRIGRLLSAKDDLLSGKLPKKSGFQREKPGPTERLLMQEIQQLLKNAPKSQEELDALWATALDKAKNRVKNRIEELQLAIDKAEKINKSKNVQNYNDAKLDELKTQLKEKQAEYDAAFPKEKSTLSDEQRLNQLINSKKKRLEKLEKQKIDKIFETKKKDGPDKSKFPELAKQITDLDAEIKKVTDDIKADEAWKTHVEKKRLELAKKANQRRIDELKRRIEEKDFITKKNPTPIDDELKQLRREKHKVADDYELAKHKFELENRSRTEKAVDGILDVLTLPKSLKATLDLSAPLRQGATVMLSNPQIFWNSFIKMHGQAFNEKTFEDSIDEIMKSDNYTLAQDSGLQITDPASADERKQDDQFTVKLVNKIPIFNKLNQGSARAYSGFLNNIRFSLFEQGVKELEAAGYKYEDNPKMFKALASTVNNLTGRGKSADGITGKFLNFILFSPRMITSRVLLLHDLMRTDIPFNSPSRKMAAKSLLGTAVYIGLFNLLGTIASNALGDDDDKDRKPNFNPVATDFLKVRSKQTTFDPTAGYAPLIRTAARIAAEKSINSNGRETDLSKSYGSTRFTPAFDFLENKLSPTISYLANVATHKNPDNKYESASEAEWDDYITGLVAPLQVMQVAQNFNDKDKFGKDLLEVILGLYGIGVQQYSDTKKNNKKQKSGIHTYKN